MSEHTNNTLSFALARSVMLAGVGLAVLYVIDTFLIFGLGLPSATRGVAASSEPSVIIDLLGLVRLAAYPTLLIFAFYRGFFLGSIENDAAALDRLAAFIIRAAFWSVLLIGITDAVLSFLRVQGLHTHIFGTSLATNLGVSIYRGTWVHIPLMAVAVLIAARTRGMAFIWLALMVVVAELLIVIARFIFSYEQTFMGDLVRFWYAALFLFASAQTLKEEGHVRVDVIYAGLSEMTKARLNAIGIVLFAIPLCWLILLRGMWSKTSLITSPLLNFETSMSGFGMYVKYLMAGFLIIFALSMLAQLSAYFLTALVRINAGASVSSREMA